MLDAACLPEDPRSVSLVLAGGIALGAFEAGAYAALHEDPALRPSWVAGASIGSVNAAIIAGNAPQDRVSKLRAFWTALASDPLPMASFWLGHPATGPWRQAQNSAGALGTALFGRPGLFRPRLMPALRAGAPDVKAFYDLAPLARRLPEFVDFDRLNRGEVRLTINATDVVSGERVAFDTGRGHTIGPLNILASCALLPMFAPVEIEGRLLADGALGANTPLDLVLNEHQDGPSLCVVVDLFATQGSRPQTLAAGVARAGDLVFGNQTRRLLEAHRREQHLREMLDRVAAYLPAEVRGRREVMDLVREGGARRSEILYISYRAGLDEAGPFKGFDFTRSTLVDRWQAGERATGTALRDLAGAERGPGVDVIEVQDGSPSTPVPAV